MIILILSSEFLWKSFLLSNIILNAILEFQEFIPFLNFILGYHFKNDINIFE